MNKFSIEYPENHIAGQLQNDFPKNDNFSVSIPLSRQQKHFDLLLFNGNNKKSLTFQVKSARTFIDEIPGYNYYSWLNNFSISNNYSDFYLIFISFPLFDTVTFRPKATFSTKILVFDNIEMQNLLSSIKLTKKGNPDKFFAMVFNYDDKRIFGDRGFNKNNRPEFSNNLYENKLPIINQAII